jgi:hypothetical protein
MSAFDFMKDIQGKVIDAATYQLLERNFVMQADNNQLLNEKNDLLNDKIVSLQARLADIEAECARLKTAISPSDGGDYEALDGVLFKKTSSGYADTPYCPNCHKILSHPKGLIFVCQSCKYTKHMRLPLGRCREILAEKLKMGTSQESAKT